MERFAAFPMYDFEPLREAQDAVWRAVATCAGIRAALRSGAPFAFTDPDLVVAQTCGLPLTTSLADVGLRVLAVPLYTAPGCDGAWHRSVVVVRADAAITTLAEARGTRCAINSWDSNTGMNLLRAAVAPLAGGAAFFGAIQVTGAHRASMAAVAAGEADLAAIDCVTWAHLGRLEPALAGRLRVVATTPASPSLPLVVPPHVTEAEIAALRGALHAVARDAALRPALETLLIAGFAELPLALYDEVGRLARAATASGYPTLA